MGKRKNNNFRSFIMDNLKINRILKEKRFIVKALSKGTPEVYTEFDGWTLRITLMDEAGDKQISLRDALYNDIDTIIVSKIVIYFPEINKASQFEIQDANTEKQLRPLLQNFQPLKEDGSLFNKEEDHILARAFVRTRSSILDPDAKIEHLRELLNIKTQNYREGNAQKTADKNLEIKIRTADLEAENEDLYKQVRKLEKKIRDLRLGKVDTEVEDYLESLNKIKISKPGNGHTPQNTKLPDLNKK